MANVITEKELNNETQSWTDIQREMTNELGFIPPDEQVQERYENQAGIKLVF